MTFIFFSEKKTFFVKEICMEPLSPAGFYAIEDNSGEAFQPIPIPVSSNMPPFGFLLIKKAYPNRSALHQFLLTRKDKD